MNADTEDPEVTPGSSRCVTRLALLCHARLVFSSQTKQTALMVASYQGLLPMVEYLVTDKKANTNHIDVNHRTALMLAAFRGHEQVVAFLLENGADPAIDDGVRAVAVGSMQGEWDACDSDLLLLLYCVAIRRWSVACVLMSPCCALCRRAAPRRCTPRR